MIAREWVVLLLNGVTMLVLAEVGFRLGRRHRLASDVNRREMMGGIEGAVLGLLGLLIGFTFAMAVDRYEKRREMVLEEATAVETAYLRASLLPPSHQAPVRAALRGYVDVRINARSIDPRILTEGLRTSHTIQRELWKHAVEASREAPGENTALFIESLNETIDAGAERIAAGRADIPAGVWLLLVVVAACGALTTAYRSGAGGVRTLFGTWFLPLLITFVIVLIFDLSRPMQGLIRISQQPLVELQQSMLRE